MTQITAPAHITAVNRKRTATFTPRSHLARAWSFLLSAVIRTRDNDVAKQYEGSSWCDRTEHDLNYDVITGRRTRRS
jgi:hypothetical protein